MRDDDVLIPIAYGFILGMIALGIVGFVQDFIL